MPIISSIGRKSPKVRALIVCIYLLLIGGGVTMVVPFLVMLSGSTKSDVDARTFDVFPGFLRDDGVLYKKHVEALFNERLDAMRVAYDVDVSSFETVEEPWTIHEALVEDWLGWLETAGLPPYTYTLGHLRAHVSKTLPLKLREFKSELQRRYHSDMDALNNALETEFVNWNAFNLYPEQYLPRYARYRHDPMTVAFRTFKERQPLGYRYYFSVEGFFRSQFLKTQYTRDIAEYNRSHGTAYDSYDEVKLTRRVCDGTWQERADWESFVRGSLNLLWLRVEPGAEPVYRQFLQAKYGTVVVLNRNYETSYGRFEDIPLVEEPPHYGVPLSDWAAFVAGWRDPDTGESFQPPVEDLRIHSVEFMFRDHLAGRYPTIASANARWGTEFSGFDEVMPPQRDAHYQAFLSGRSALRREFATRNYKTVLDYMLLHGRGIANTAIYCFLAVLAALIVNPMAAYAMSRYRPPSTYKLLLFMLLTMAFPPMVTQIPVFLMLRDMNMLNTFAALILPGLAHGYSIFLLKGFFDSLPRELFECAQLDGAGEWSMFWRITMSLSKPILAVIALHAFTVAYSNFMFALLICQDERMWTLMVWLYQLQQRSGPAVLYASLILAAIPTFLIFVFCQNIILRGIVVPAEK